MKSFKQELNKKKYAVLEYRGRHMNGAKGLAETLSGTNGNIIRWAREYYNMSPDEAAIAIGVDTTKYLNWENNLEFPTYAKLKRISEVFHKPSAIFFFPEPPKLPTIKGDLRTLSDAVVNTFSKNIILQFEKAKVYQISLKELYGNKDSIISQRNLFPKDLNHLCYYFRNALDFPISAQKKHKNPKDVFEIYREKFYSLGIYVFKDAFKDNQVSGICINDNYFPVIIINNSMSFTRQIFTLFHELYHLISDTSGAEIIKDDFYTILNKKQTQIERACDTFANGFLVPTHDFKAEIANKILDDHSIEELASLYSVSREVIMYKLWKMNKTTSFDYNELKEIFYGEAIRNKQNKHDDNSRGNYYNTHLSYLGQQYTGAVFREYYAGQIDIVHASEMLNCKANHIPSLEATFFRGKNK